MTLNPGTKLGPYEVVGLLGAGGMGEVYRARDTRLGRDVAIKILPVELSADTARRQRFEREARTISGLNHPHICVLYDVGSQDGVDYLVMECAEGETLANRLQKGPLPLALVMKYGAQIADGLARAHRSGVVHRDLKPSNVMLTATGAKLLDFGLAKPAVEPASLATLTMTPPVSSPVTQEGMVVGTFQYMSPEQVEGRELDGRSDIFSLGAVLYEMLTGKKAFAGKSQLSVASAILEREPEPISALKPTTPVAIDRTIRKCLAKAPDERWQSASDLATQLNWITDSSESVAAVTRSSRWGATKLGWLTSAALLALLAGIGWAGLFGKRAPKTTTVYASPFHLAANWLALSPDGKTVAMVAYWDPGNKYMIWLYRMGEAQATTIEGTDGASSPFWSPDGQSIGFFAQGKLKRTDVNGKSVQVIADAPNGRGGTWNKDGVIVFTPDVFTGLYRVPAAGGAATEITHLDNARLESSHRWPVFLPDGKHFLYHGANFAGHYDMNAIFVGALDSSERKLIAPASSNAVYAAPGYLLYVKDGALVAQRFDLQNFETSGDPQVVRNEIQYLLQINLGLFDAASNAALVAQFGKTGVESQLTWYDRNGRKLGSVGGIGSFGNPSLSPDERRVAFDQANPDGRDIGIWIHDLDKDAPTRLTLNNSLNQVPIWSPDGKRMVFTSNRMVFNRIFEKNSDGSGAEEEFADDHSEKARQVVAWDWSSNGKWVLERREAELWYYAVAESVSRPYIQGPYLIRNAQFSPDGKYVAYASNETGRWEVYVTPFPQASSKWQVSRSGGEEPRWRKDGKELFYLSPEGALIAAKVKLGSSFEAMAPVPLFQSRRRQKLSSQDSFSYAVAKDGNRFLFNTIVDQRSATPLTIIQNWTGILEK